MAPQHRYDIGQKLLCFEPDTSKAKVIYFAKILKHVEYNKSNVPHYAVHFHGWKCKWDREVPEHLLLDNTEFNRTLKKKIDEVVRHERCRTRRKQRIDMVLKAAALAGDNVDWDSLPGVWIPKHKQERADSLLPCPQSPSDRTCSEPAGSIVSEDCDSELMDNENVTQSQFEALSFHQLFAPSVVISGNLCAIIDAHCASPTGNIDPCTRGWCSVLQVLQSYVDNFPYAEIEIPSSRIQVNCSDRVFRRLNPAFAKTDQSRLMCADICSSLRVLFDCMLDRYLLLPEEQNLDPSRFHQFKCRGRAFPPDLYLPPTISPLYRYSSPRYELFPESEAELRNTAPCLNYPAHFFLRLFVNLPEMLNAMNLTACRRTIVIRHVYMLLNFLDLTRHWWFAHQTPRSFALHTSELPDESGVRSGHKSPNTSRPTTSETSSETEPQAFTEGSASQLHRSSPRLSAHSPPSFQLGSPAPDLFTDSATAIKIPTSQAIISPAQLELTVHKEANSLATNVQQSSKPKRLSKAINASASDRTETNHMGVRTRRSHGSTNHAKLSVPVVQLNECVMSDTSSIKSNVKSSTPPRTLRPRISQVHYK